jgi:hypothetical protein
MSGSKRLCPKCLKPLAQMDLDGVTWSLAEDLQHGGRYRQFMAAVPNSHKGTAKIVIVHRTFNFDETFGSEKFDRLGPDDIGPATRRVTFEYGGRERFVERSHETRLKEAILSHHGHGRFLVFRPIDTGLADCYIQPHG